MCGSNAGAIEVRAIEVGVLGLNNGRGWRWYVCDSNAEVFILECLFEVSN